MAGTLTVQNIEGPSSGSNANKVILPAGQTLDVSAGTFTPSAGQILKTQLHQWTNHTQTTSNSFVDVSGSSFSFTPASASSKLFIQYSYAWYRSSASTGSGLEVVVNIDGTRQNTVQPFEHYLGSLNASAYSRGHKIDEYTNSTSAAKTIKLQFRNYDNSDRVDINESNFVSSIYVQEIVT